MLDHLKIQLFNITKSKVRSKYQELSLQVRELTCVSIVTTIVNQIKNNKYLKKIESSYIFIIEYKNNTKFLL